MALLNPDYVDSITQVVEKEYLEEFPELTGRYEAFICDTADGVGN